MNNSSQEMNQHAQGGTGQLGSATFAGAHNSSNGSKKMAILGSAGETGAEEFSPAADSMDQDLGKNTRALSNVQKIPKLSMEVSTMSKTQLMQMTSLELVQLQSLLLTQFISAQKQTTK